MRIFTLQRQPISTSLDRDIALIKEGFSWPAFFFSFVWALWNRLWLEAIVILAAWVALQIVFDVLRIDAVSDAVLSLGMSTLIGFIGNDLKRAKLARRGYRYLGVVAAADAEAGLRRFVDLYPDTVRPISTFTAGS